MNTNSQRVQNDTPALERPKHHGSDKRQLVPVTGCIPRFINDQLERIRDQGGKKKLSKSSVVANIIVRGVQTDVNMQYGATLEPVIETTIKRTLRRETSRSANLALEAFYSSEETRIVCVYILRFLLGKDIELLPQILKDCHDQAQENVERALHEAYWGKEQN